MDEEKNEEVNEETNEETNDDREEETKDEIRDEDYANDDEIEMDDSMERRLEKIEGMLTSIKDTLSLFVDSGAIIRENVSDEGEISEDDFAEDFIDIDELDLSL